MIRFKPVLCAAFVSILLTTTCAFGQSSPTAADRILGTWLTAEGKARVEIYKASDCYAGKLIWVRDSLKNGAPALDDKNPDPALRNRPVLNLEILYSFEFDGDDTWAGGRVYDPESGEEYRGKLRLEDGNTMKLRGYVLVPLLGRTETWTRVK